MPKKNFDNSQFSRNKDFDKRWRQEGLERLDVSFAQIQSLATAGWQELQNQLWKIEAVLQPADMEFANAVVTGSIGQNEYQKRMAGFAPERKNLLVYLLLILFTMSFLISCAAPPDATPTDVIAPPTATAYVEKPPADNPPAIESTATAFADLDIDYGSFTGFEPIVDPVLEDAWQEIIDSEVASPLGIDVIDVSSTNILVKVKPGNGYDNDTYFTISNIPGHEGEVLTVSLAGVNRVAGGTAVRLAIGINGLPVGLDIDNNVVGYIDETGQWVAGSLELAPSLPGTPAEPEPTPAEVDYFDMTPEERLEQSLGFVEQANGYSGEVSFVADDWADRGTTAPFWWAPSLGEWKTTSEFTTGTGGVDENLLDRNGETLPPVAAAGYENNDGSLVLIHPETGAEIVFPATVTVPGIGVISIRDLMNMSLDDLNNLAVNTSETIIGNPEERIYQMQEVMRVKGTSYPGFAIGFDNLFPITSAAGDEIPERKGSITEVRNHVIAVPIFSPETGDFMLWAIIQKGSLASNAEFRTNGDQFSYSTVPFTDGLFGQNGNNFGIFMEYSSPEQPSLAYARGGFEQVVGPTNDPAAVDTGMGDIYTIQRLLEARTDEEVLSILAEQGIIWSIPSATVFEVSQ
ncbi:MAG: hypothetical protein ACOZAK_00680 [Patescibacteria group bacterium]